MKRGLMRHLANLDVCTCKAYFVVFRGTLTYTFVHAIHISKTSCLFKVLMAIYFFLSIFQTNFHTQSYIHILKYSLPSFFTYIIHRDDRYILIDASKSMLEGWGSSNWPEICNPWLDANSGVILKCYLLFIKINH